MRDTDRRFWRHKALEDMTDDEWEALCDGCGRCCLVKLEDEDTGDIYLTSVACRLLDPKSCRCRDYENRFAKMPDCVSLSPETVRQVSWLPVTCAYRLVRDGLDLPWWHPLVSGDPQTVHQAGIAVGSWVTSEAKVPAAEIDRYIIADFSGDETTPDQTTPQPEQGSKI